MTLKELYRERNKLEKIIVRHGCYSLPKMGLARLKLSNINCEIWGRI